MRFKRQAPHRNHFSGQVVIEKFFQLRHQLGFHAVVNINDRSQNAEVIIRFLSRLGQGLHIFGETTAPIPDTGEKEALANTAVRANTLAHIIYIGSQPLTEICNLIHKRNFSCQKGISSIFGELSRALFHENDRIALPHKRVVERFHYFARPGRRGAHHYPLGLHEIFHRYTFTQKLGIRHHIELGLCARCNARLHFFGRADRHCALVYYYGIILQQRAQVMGHFENVFQIGRTIFALGRGQCQENHFGSFNALSQIRGEKEAALLDVTLKQKLKPGFINRDLSALQLPDFFRIDINTGDRVSRFGKTRTGHKPDIPGSDYSNLHFKNQILARKIKRFRP